ncbi:unnamed protein product [Prunus brigantina]
MSMILLVMRLIWLACRLILMPLMLRLSWLLFDEVFPLFVLFLHIIFMIIVSWNVRGAGKYHWDLKKAYGIDVFAILEPRIGGSRALSVAKSLGFSHYHIVDPIGFFGGVWLLWNGNSVSLHVVAHSSQTITALVIMDAKRWLLTVVYASPCSNVKTSLWKYFDGLAAVCNLPWLLLGDFNDIVCGEEKLGGNFIEWIDRNHLIDLGFSGANFTWCNKRGEEDIIWKRLDRGLCNIDWRFLFSEAHLSHLPRVNSDHCPIMVKFFSNHLPATKSMPFRFQAMWLSHPSFSEFLSSLWNSGTGHAFQKSASLIWPLQCWNKQYFPQLERFDCTRLNGEVSDVEFQSSLFAIGGLKTPGPDGASLPEHLNDILIALVPKVERPLNMAQLRPISLCNTLYKVVSKILVSRLRPIMTKIVIPIQVSFVPGRHIVDNIVIAQEMLHKFKVAKGQKGFIAWKIDLSKAYDRLSWSFIREASIEQCLDDFCSFSGQKVSFEKSMVCVSPNTCPGLAQNIASISGSPLSDNLGKYLGVPLIHTRVNKDTYQEIIDKVQKRLSYWKSHTLSMAGRLTLLQSVTSAIPIYSMQTAMLPASVCSKLDQLNKNFLWGHAFDKAKVHLVNWETMCKVGSGDSILFWTDVWLSCGALINYALIDLSEEMLQLNVSDFLEEGLWDIACLQECLPPDIVLMITSIHAGFIDSGPDMCIWRFTSNGKFSVKSAYQLFCPVEAGSNWHWEFIWRLQLPPKVKTFLWVLCHKKLLTNAQRLRGGMAVSTSCPRCIYHVESVEHLFKGCSSSLLIWNQFGNWFEESSGLCPNFDDWLFHNLHSKRSFMTGLAWNLVFAVSLWFI